MAKREQILREIEESARKLADTVDTILEKDREMTNKYPRMYKSYFNDAEKAYEIVRLARATKTVADSIKFECNRIGRAPSHTGRSTVRALWGKGRDRSYLYAAVEKFCELLLEGKTNPTEKELPDSYDVLVRQLTESKTASRRGR